MLNKPAHAGRPAQPPGKTYLKYSPDGKKMVVAGCSNFCRLFETDDMGEPDMILDVHENTLALAAGDDYCILGAEDGTVCQYDIDTKKLDKMLVRSSLPIRDIALSPDQNWIAVSSDEIEIKLVNRGDMEQIKILQNHPKPIKHLTYNPTGTYLAASCTDGVIYLYDMRPEQPILWRKIDGVARSLETDADATSRCVWHPDGKVLACATPTRDIILVSIEDGTQQRPFTDGHMGDITSMAWSPNGALLATSSADDNLIIWETRTQKIIENFKYENILHITWGVHGRNIFSWTNSWGEVYIIYNFLTDENHIQILSGPKQSVPILHDSLEEGNTVVGAINGPATGQSTRIGADTPDSLDDLLGPADDEEYGSISADDGGEYANYNGKRTNRHLDNLNGHAKKRQSVWDPKVHDPFQPGATPWRGNRRYLCLNLTGFVWTVDHDIHNTVTVEFYDPEAHRDFHFTDPFLYDKACLNEIGVLFSCPPHNGQPAMVFYRPHETWTSRADWRIQLPENEDVVAIALSECYIVVTTSANYVRVYTLFGMPVKIYRQKSSPTVTCAAWGDYIMTVSNGSVGGDGRTQLLYTIENVRQDEVCQNEDVVALGSGDGVTLKTVLFSDQGDPCIYDSTGTLLTLVHWRTPGQAKWVPILDTRRLDRLATGRKEKTYWPVAVAQEKFHCIILKGGDQHPYFPRPLFCGLDLRVPVSTLPADSNHDKGESNASAAARMEERYVRHSVMFSLIEDVASSLQNPPHSRRVELASREAEIDKVLLQMLALECREGEDRGMKALEIVGLMKDRAGKMVEAASKIASRWGRTVLEDKIRELGERRLMGLEEE